MPQPPPATDAEVKESRLMARKLVESKIYQDYEKAFAEATGLPLALRPIQSFQLALAGKRNANPFCLLLAKTNRSCAACLSMQAELEREASLAPRTLSCFAGLCDTAVPIRIGDKLIAFLQTGQVLLHKPKESEFSQLTQTLLKWGVQVDLKSLEEAYFQSKVFTPEQYQAFIRLLTTFAEHLALISGSLSLKEANVESVAVSRARKLVAEKFDQKLSLDDAARAVNTSVRYFCKLFKESTGMTFVDYLTRTRVEKAKALLGNPRLQVSEAAYQVGFESLSQFNRSFKRITGKTPTAYRDSEGGTPNW